MSGRMQRMRGCRRRGTGGEDAAGPAGLPACGRRQTHNMQAPGRHSAQTATSAACACPPAAHRRRDHWVTCLVRHARVAALPPHHDAEAVGRRKCGAGLQGRGAAGQPAIRSGRGGPAGGGRAPRGLHLRGARCRQGTSRLPRERSQQPRAFASTVPVGVAGSTCRPNTAAAPSSAPSCIITRAPPSPSSAGWNSRRTVPCERAAGWAQGAVLACFGRRAGCGCSWGDSAALPASLQHPLSP